jgi:hypothetical protein
MASSPLKQMFNDKSTVRRNLQTIRNPSTTPSHSLSDASTIYSAGQYATLYVLFQRERRLKLDRSGRKHGRNYQCLGRGRK